MARTLLQRVHNPHDHECGCDPDCWCRRTRIGRAVKWWFPARYFGIRHKNSFFDGMVVVRDPRLEARAGVEVVTHLTRTRAAGAATVEGMDEARRVLERLARIEALDRAKAAPGELLDELRSLVREAEEWTRAEGGDAEADEAVRRLRASLAHDMIGV